MTFDDAVEQMKSLAGEDHWSFQYEVASYMDGAQIHGYISRLGVGHAEPHNTYQGAIENMKAKINERAKISDRPPEEREVV
jgi:hypothetical protein